MKWNAILKAKLENIHTLSVVIRYKSSCCLFQAEDISLMIGRLNTRNLDEKVTYEVISIVTKQFKFEDGDNISSLFNDVTKHVTKLVL